MSGYTREQFAAAVDAAHDALHGVSMADMSSAAAWLKIAAAHDALHAVGAGAERTGCATPDPEAQRLAAEWLAKLNSTGLPCGHRLADLVGGPGAVTKCGACLAERQRSRDALPSPHDFAGALRWLELGAPAASENYPGRPAVRTLRQLLEALPSHLPVYCYASPEWRAAMGLTEETPPRAAILSQGTSYDGGPALETTTCPAGDDEDPS